MSLLPHRNQLAWLSLLVISFVILSACTPASSQTPAAGYITNPRCNQAVLTIEGSTCEVWLDPHSGGTIALSYLKRQNDETHSVSLSAVDSVGAFVGLLDSTDAPVSGTTATLTLYNGQEWLRVTVTNDLSQYRVTAEVSSDQFRPIVPVQDCLTGSEMLMFEDQQKRGLTDYDTPNQFFVVLSEDRARMTLQKRTSDGAVIMAEYQTVDVPAINGTVEIHASDPNLPFQLTWKVTGCGGAYAFSFSTTDPDPVELFLKP